MIAPWKIWIDTGGTFTDCLAITPQGDWKRLKVLSSSLLRGTIPAQRNSTHLQVEMDWPVALDIFLGFTIRFSNGELRKVRRVEIKKNIIHVDRAIQIKNVGYVELTTKEEVPVLAARLLTHTPLHSEFPPIELKLGSTRGTNALLERKGSKTAFLITSGFRDLLRIGTQQRPDLFALNILKKEPLYSTVLEVNERMEYDGEVLKPLEKSETFRVLDFLKAKGVESVAIAFLHSYKNAAHERMLEAELRKAGVNYVSPSYQLSSQLKILPRAETAVVNAYLHPIIDRYISGISDRLKTRSFQIMSSAGGLLDATSFHAKDSLLSGPAGGVIGALAKAKLSGVNKIIAFDMGGTSTDVSLSNKRPEYRFECEIGDQKILSPSLAIETIAAGGGSICNFDGFRFTVGPQSAGATPGPACYGSGGPLTITDVNLLLGRLSSENFSIPISTSNAEQALEGLIRKVKKATGKAPSKISVLLGLLQIANEKMAEAVKKVSIQQGHDPKEYALVSFGGAGGQHACSLATMLGIKKVIVPYDAGLLSAYGIGQAQVERIEEKLILRPLAEFLPQQESLFNTLFQRAHDELSSEKSISRQVKEKNRFVFLRLKGQESSLEVEVNERTNILHEFKHQYKKVYGHWIKDRMVEVESIRLRVIVINEKQEQLKNGSKKYSPNPLTKRNIYSQTKFTPCSVYQWEQLTPGAAFRGPALVLNNNATLWVEHDWNFSLDKNNTAILRQHATQDREGSFHSSETSLTLFTNRFTSIAQQMGALLQRTAFSVNVKERLDFSCALLDAKGRLIVNAPHIPVHLGSLGVCVRQVRKKISMSEGDVVITNHPAFGGSHLPDITLIKPVFFERKLIGYVVNRAHHAEIGGKQPGSMPADATCLEEEGVIISPMYLIKGNKPQWKNVERKFNTALYPTRALQENLADLNAALASVTLGESALKDLCKHHGFLVVKKYMKLLKVHATLIMRERIRKLPFKKLTSKEFLDDGSPLEVTISKNGSKLLIDFSGSAGTHPGNLNATPAIVNSVILYVMRLLLNEPVPLNEGLLEDVKVVLPRGILNPKFYASHAKSPAVVGGNTEVSQRLTDTLLKAFGLAACSQGTMNNFLFGNDTFGYYETICGGTGAGEGFHGADAVHQHMTNTRITDPEILEWRYPVRVGKFEVRTNSGGRGKWRGGDGVVREILFKEEMKVNVLTQHRVEQPYGVKGGKPGKRGEQYIVRRNGTNNTLKAIDGTVVYSGDKIIIKTPGGGGWGTVK
jgi:5-oxoprolinase (ATP-hydrolysing)